MAYYRPPLTVGNSQVSPPPMMPMSGGVGAPGGMGLGGMSNGAGQNPHSPQHHSPSPHSPQHHSPQQHSPGFNQEQCSKCGSKPNQLLSVQATPTSPEVRLCEACYKEEFSCVRCRNPIDGPYVPLEGGKKAHPNCASAILREAEDAIPKCGLCKQQFYKGLQYPHEGKMICEHCFQNIYRCRGCGKNVTDEYLNFDLPTGPIKCHAECKHLVFVSVNHAVICLPKEEDLWCQHLKEQKNLCQQCAYYTQQQVASYRPPAVEQPGLHIDSKPFEAIRIDVQRLDNIRPGAPPQAPIALSSPYPQQPQTQQIPIGPTHTPTIMPTPGGFVMPQGTPQYMPSSNYVGNQGQIPPRAMTAPAMPMGMHPPIPKAPGIRPIAVPIEQATPKQHTQYGAGQICKVCRQPIYSEMISALRANSFWHAACFSNS